MKEDLRKSLAQLAAPPAPAHPPLATGSAAVDMLIGGGLPRGRLVEMTGPWSSGKTALALAAAARATAEGGLVAYVDARRELYPPAAAQLGVDLERLLVVRPPPTAAAIARAGEIVARSRAFALVLLDFPEGQRLEDAAAARLRAAAHASGTAVVALAPRRGALAQAAVKLEVWPREVMLHRGGTAPPGTSSRFRPAAENAALLRGIDIEPVRRRS